MPINIFHRRQRVAQSLGEKAQQTVAQLAQTLGISKSSAQRHRHAIHSRQADPVSAFWSSAAGLEYLVRLMVLVVYCFGIQGGVGAESISRFMRLAKLDEHVGSSASAIRSFKQQLIVQINRYGSIQQSQVSLPASKRLIVGGDETFFNHPLLVLMELSSGYLFFEVEKRRRTFESWQEEVKTLNLPKDWQIEAMVSDGAGALIKLAVEGFECVSLPDVFHVLRDLGAPFARRIGQERARLERQATKLSERKDKRRHAKAQADYEATLVEQQQQSEKLAQHHQQYQQAIHSITTRLHPFRLDTGEWQLASELDAQLSVPLTQLETLADSLSLSAQQSAIATFRTQIPALGQGLTQWWCGTMKQLIQRTQDEAIQQWALTGLLPYAYWHQQASKTRTPALKTIYQKAEQSAHLRLNAHSISDQFAPDEQQQWHTWAQQQCACFQRTSSAIEGRNGQLSRLHHNLRGLSPKTLQAFTIIHNFDTFRADGTCPAQRLFHQSFPSLPEWLVQNTHQLPLPRKSKKEQPPQPLFSKVVPA